MHHATIIKAINEAPLNRGLRGVDWIAEPGNIAFVEGQDVILFDRDADGIFEIHVLLESRGKAAAACINRALAMMFQDHKAETIFGLVPEQRRDVAMIARWCKMQFIQKTQRLGDRVDLFQITKEQWAALCRS